MKFLMKPGRRCMAAKMAAATSHQFPTRIVRIVSYTSTASSSTFSSTESFSALPPSVSLTRWKHYRPKFDTGNQYYLATAFLGMLSGFGMSISLCENEEQKETQLDKSEKLSSHKHFDDQRHFSKKGVRDPMTSYMRYAIMRAQEEQDHGKDKQRQAEQDQSEHVEEQSQPLKLEVQHQRQRKKSRQETLKEVDDFLTSVHATSSAVYINAENNTTASEKDLEDVTRETKQHPGGLKIFSGNIGAENTMTSSERDLEEATRKAKQHSGGLKIFSGNGNMPLALEIARHLGINLGKATVGRFADGEANVVINENVRGKDVYVIQPTSPPVNDNIMELLLMISTLRRASARRITVVIPYYGYARQDRKMQARVPISAADIARLMEAMGVDRVIAVDLHCGQIQGFFGPRVPVDNLDGGIVGLDYFGCKDLHNPVIVSPDAGGVYRAKKFKEGLEQKYEMQDLGLAMIVKQRARAGAVDQMDLVGDVRDCDCILVDDMIDTAGTLVKASEVLIENGARRVFAFASHGLLSGPGNDRIANSRMEEVVILNTIPTSPQREANEKLTTLSVAPLLAQAIFNIHAKKSISALFK